MKKYSRKASKRSKKMTKKSRKMTYRRRQRGGASGSVTSPSGAVASASITVKFTLSSSGNITNIVSSNPSVSGSFSSLKVLKLTSTIPIKNIKVGDAPEGKMGGSLSNTGIHIQKDSTTGQFIIPQTSYLFKRPLTPTQKKLDNPAGEAFPNGILISNLDFANLGLTGTTDKTVTITLTI